MIELRRFALATLLLIFPTSGFACQFCSGSTILNDVRAQCFLTTFDERLKKLEKSSRGFVRVDLDECTGQTKPDSRALLSNIPDRTGVDGDGGKLFLDHDRMMCLKDFIELADGRFDPAQLVTIQAACGA